MGVDQPRRASRPGLRYLTALTCPGTISAVTSTAIDADADRCILDDAAPGPGAPALEAAAETLGDLDIIGINLGKSFATMEIDDVAGLQQMWTDTVNAISELRCQQAENRR
jgi:hypothetical protein